MYENNIIHPMFSDSFLELLETMILKNSDLMELRNENLKWKVIQVIRLI